MSSFFNVLQFTEFPLSVNSCLQTMYRNQSVGQSKNKTVDRTSVVGSMAASLSLVPRILTCLGATRGYPIPSGFPDQPILVS